ncbi:LacI family DNA-binding transcriptional regulator [Paenibacillus validus]|uniref:LacI family DNA-binding transcriptional regulator n=1 Tax=Paenibacillus validus TaxID=44253 RepID=UPI003D2CFEC4
MKRERGSRITLKHVAEHAGVSPSTVSLVLRGSSEIPEITHRKVMDSINHLGYVYDRVAANLRSRNSSTIGLIVAEIANPFFSELLNGVHQSLDKQGYTVILGATFDLNTNQDRLISTMLEYRVGGVIMSPISGSSQESIERLRKWGIPVVLVGKMPANANFDYVSADYSLGAQMAVEHLIRKGHRRISFLGGVTASSSWQARKQGYLNALNEAGLEYDESLIITSTVTKKGGFKAVQQLLQQPNPPTASFCYNDLVAFGVMAGLTQAGLKPGRDMAIVGFDNIEESEMFTPTLTTVSASPHLMGTYAANLLHQRIMGMDDDRPQQIILKPELVIRESCSS